MNNYGSRRPVNGPGRKKKRDPIIPFLCFVSVWLFILGAILIFASIKNNSPASPAGTNESGTNDPGVTVGSPGGDGTVDPEGTDDPGSSSGTSTTPEPVTYKEATILSAGDIIAHLAQIYYAEAAGSNGKYDFTNTFKYVKDVVSSADYAVANFETTLAGDSVAYSGYPRFNAPDEILDAISGAGFDMMLFANNHCYDTRLDGLLRTQEQFIDHDLDYIGAKRNPTDDAYAIVDVNGIKIGMLNYADDLSGGNTERRTINGSAIRDGDISYMNLYNLSLLDELYSEVDTIIAKMKSEGVDLIIAYMHWGYEYHIEHNSQQKKVAQALCDHGVDVIIGGHPHVMQDAEVLTSTTDENRKTLCFYSLGNLVSNQSRHTPDFDVMNESYTEAGLMVTLTVRKYSTGEAMVSRVETTPTYMHRYRASNGKYAHEIVPLTLALDNPSAYGLDASKYGESDARDVFKLETDLLGDTVDVFNSSIVLPAVGEPAS